MSETKCCGCNAYSLAKTTTLIEMCLTCNCLLFLEYYGVDNKKKIFVLFFIILRFFGMMVEFIWAIIFFASAGGWINEFIEELIKGINDSETEETLR